MEGKLSHLKEFDSLVVMHPRFEDVVDTVMTHVQLGAPGRLLMVVGPTGVGKTTLGRYIENELAKYVADNPDCGYSSPLYLEAAAPETGEFSWKAFYLRALRELGVLGIHRKISIDKAYEHLREAKSVGSYTHLAIHELRAIYEGALRERRPIAVFIDEVQHLAKCRSLVRKADNLDVAKSLSNGADTTYIQLGTYEARSMMYHGAQLARRVTVAHFSRYTKASRDFDAFARVCASINEHLGVNINQATLNNINYLYNHSLGCIGILVSWFRQAAERAIKRNHRKIEYDDLEKTRLTNIQLAAIANEMASFEREHSNTTAFDPAKYGLVVAEGRAGNTPVARSTKKKPRPGKRHPARDPVGTL